MGKSNAADLDDLQILTYQIVRGKLTVTEYLDASTGEILSAEEAKRLGLTVSRSEARAKRQRKLDALRVEVRAFALFVLAFRNRRSGLMVPLPQIVQWYAMLKRRQPQHVNRYIPRLIELGILESATLVHQDFMIHDRGIHIGDLKGEEFSAYVRFWDKLMDARAKEERPVTELDNSSTLQ